MLLVCETVEDAGSLGEKTYCPTDLKSHVPSDFENL